MTRAARERLSRAGLAPVITRRALLQECLYAFAEIRRLAGLPLQLGLEGELLLERVRGRGIERLLDQTIGECWAGGQALRQSLRFAHQFVVVDALPDQSPAGCLLSANRLREQ